MAALPVHRFLEADLAAPQVLPFGGGHVAVASCKTPAKERPNEDGALLVPRHGGGLLAVADGAGGQAAGGRASAVALEVLEGEVADPARPMREAVLTAFERANAAIAQLRVGAAATLVAVEVDGETLRSYHVGDSEVLLVGQRGRRKYQSISHSPVGYAVEAGVLDEAEALHHEERHVVSNMLGGDTLHIDVSARLKMAPRDTLLLGSDGLFDNLRVEEIVDLVRTGSVEDAAARLLARVHARMRGESAEPSKPDDVTFLLYRRALPPRRARAQDGAPAL